MSINYNPLGGLAGRIAFELRLRSNGHLVGSRIELDVFEFQQNPEEAEANDIFENEDGELIKDYYGQRQVISFLVANAVPLGSQNLVKILALLDMINIINNQGLTHRLEIYYRQGSTFASTISDAVYSGTINQNEVTAAANAGQTIPLEFKSRHLETDIEMLVEEDESIRYGRVLLENNDDAYILTEDGGYIRLENKTMVLPPVQ